MAINPYYVANPYAANPYYVPQAPTFYPTQFAQNPIPQIQTQASVQPQAAGQSNIIWIKGGDDEAKMFPVAPNTAVTLWNENEPVVYLKQADATGKPTLKIFDLVERKSPEAEVKEEKSAEYAPKSDMDYLIGIVKGLNETINKMQEAMLSTNECFSKDIETIKGDMYGIAGKKRVPRKVEAEEDA